MKSAKNKQLSLLSYIKIQENKESRTQDSKFKLHGTSYNLLSGLKYLSPSFFFLLETHSCFKFRLEKFKKQESSEVSKTWKHHYTKLQTDLPTAEIFFLKCRNISDTEKLF